MPDISKLKGHESQLDKGLCILFGHPYLPAFKKVTDAYNWRGEVKTIEYLLCPRCGVSYHYAYHEWWHIDFESEERDKAWVRLGKVETQKKQRRKHD